MITSQTEVSDVSDSSCVVSWSQPDTGGLSLRSYDVRVKKETALVGRGNQGRVEWETTSFESISADQLWYKVTGLSEGETYQIQVSMSLLDFFNL